MFKIVFIVLLSLSFLPSVQAKVALEHIKLPSGFQIDLYATNIKNARSMALSPNGTLFVGTRENSVYAVVDEDKDHHADHTYIIAQGLNMPNGVAFKDGALYVAEIQRILRFDDIENNLSHPPKPVIVYDQLPQDRHHGWKYLSFGPDDWLYFGIGAPCNVCDREDPYSSIYRIKADGSQGEVFARGIRNTVGFAWHPETKDLWFTDNGRDLLGDDVPPDELNRASQNNQHYGFPYCHGKGINDPEFGNTLACSSTEKPVQELGPHVAALGIKFYTGQMFPNEYHNQIFIAEHGSWNRSTKIGYRIMLIKLKGNESASYEVFASGWLQKDDQVLGRPVDVLIMPDGSMLVSDDYAGVIYRITYAKK